MQLLISHLAGHSQWECPDYFAVDGIQVFKYSDQVRAVLWLNYRDDPLMTPGGQPVARTYLVSVI